MRPTMRVKRGRRLGRKGVRRSPVAIALAGLAAAFALRAVAASPGPAERIVSINPSTTEILLALGAADRLVGIDDWSARDLPAVAHLPRVGGLFSPSLEAVVALQPDLVVLVPSAEQRDFRRRLERLGVPVLSLRNISLSEVLASIRTLGERLGRTAAARERVAVIERARAEVMRVTRGRARPRAVLVIQRDPLFIVGGGNFVDEMLVAASAVNVGGALSEPYPRVATEWLVAAAPEVILDTADDPVAAAEYWSRWGSLPAVSAGRVVSLPGGLVARPGPYLDLALRALAEALHGPELRLSASGKP